MRNFASVHANRANWIRQEIRVGCGGKVGCRRIAPFWAAPMISGLPDRLRWGSCRTGGREGGPGPGPRPSGYPLDPLRPSQPVDWRCEIATTHVAKSQHQSPQTVDFHRLVDCADRARARPRRFSSALGLDRTGQPPPSSDPAQHYAATHGWSGGNTTRPDLSLPESSRRPPTACVGRERAGMQNYKDLSLNRSAVIAPSK